MCAPREFGFELCLKSHAEDIRTDTDIVMLLMHWRLLRHSFLSIGDMFDETLIPSELLPKNLGWNGEYERYMVKYTFKNKFFLCSVAKIGKEVVVLLQTEAYLRMASFRVSKLIDGPDLNINMQRCLKLSQSLDSRLIQPLIEMHQNGSLPVIEYIDS